MVGTRKEISKGHEEAMVKTGEGGKRVGKLAYLQNPSQGGGNRAKKFATKK